MNIQATSVINSLLFLSTILLFSACNDDDGIAEREWQLVWQDEFNGPQGAQPDPAKWTYDIGTDWGNAQLEYDTDRPENVSFDGEGNLAITAIKESFSGSGFTSGRIKTEGLLAQTYGRFEARMKMPYGQGIWPAFWLLGTDIGTVGWPQCGEIDIMEYRGQQPNIILGSVHGPGYSGGNSVTQSYVAQNDRFDNGFHVYRVDWGEDYINYYIDDNLYFQISPEDVPGEWVYDHDFFIILNLAIGGNFLGSPNDETVFPQSLLVDYVRVYKEK